MCTVTYVRTDSGFILTSNRDEHILRKKSKLPQKKDRVLYPEDGEASGTWIGTSDTGRVICLLNGAFERHTRKKSYRKSRGLIVLELFKLSGIEKLKDKYALRGIEPFTIIWIETQPKLMLYEFRWDGKQKYLKKINTGKPHIWSSSTLYDQEVKALREQWFEIFLANQSGQIDVYDLLDFHKSAGDGVLEHHVMMKRSDGVQTVSTSQIRYEDNAFQFLHQNYQTTKASLTEMAIEMN